MAYLVRKLMKRDLLCEEYIQEKDVTLLYADIPTTEFRTKNGTLSTWRIESPKELEKAIMAIAVVATKIEKMDLILIDTQLLDSNNLNYCQTYAGQEIAVSELQDLHYDIMEITLSSLIKCANIYKKIVSLDNAEEKFIVRVSAGEIRERMIDAVERGNLDMKLVSEKIRNEINRYMSD